MEAIREGNLEFGLDRNLDRNIVDTLVNEATNAIIVDLAMTADLDDFLADPIGYGDFDHNDPIALTDFEVSRIMHSLYIEPLT